MNTEDRPPIADLTDEVLRLHGRLIANGDPGKAAGLTHAQALVLTAVVNAERPPTVPQIGRSLGHARQSVQRIADALVARGLVAAKENPDHKRAPLLIVTEAGRATHRRLEEHGEAWMARVTEGIDQDDIAAAARTLRAFRARLEADLAGRRRPPVAGAGDGPRGR
jgi:DNA-binding MarR family transcriptional regulator